MSNGPLGGMALSQHIPTPQAHADALRHLVTFPSNGQITLGDLTGCGAGNLLAPFVGLPHTHLFGIEISAERADAAQARLPSATIIRAPFEATRPTAQTFSLCVTNPPYVRLDDGRRAEYAAQVLVTNALVAGGVSLAIIPARSGLDGTLINHYARNYTQLRCWRFPDGNADADSSFQKYSQIVLAAVKRAESLDAPDPLVKAQLQGWRYDSEKIRGPVARRRRFYRTPRLAMPTCCPLHPFTPTFLSYTPTTMCCCAASPLTASSTPRPGSRR